MLNQPLTSLFTLLQRYPLVLKEIFLLVCRSSHLHTNSSSTAAEIQPLDCNKDTTKQQELGNSCIVTKSPCCDSRVFLAVLVTQWQEASSLSKAVFLLFVCLFFSFLLFFLIYISSRNRVLVTRSLSGLGSMAVIYMSKEMNSHIFTSRYRLSAT